MDNSTAISYLSDQGGTRSPLLNSIAQLILRWAGLPPVMLAQQFIMGRNNVLADFLSRPNQILGSEWNLKTEIFQFLRKRWSVAIDLFATSLNHQCCPYFSPFHDLNALGTDAMLQNWNGWQASAFPPWSLIPAVLKKLRSSSGVLLTIIASYWPQRLWFPELLDLVVDGPIPLPLSRDLLRQPHFHRYHLGVPGLSLHAWRLCCDSPGLRVFSSHVARQASLARRSSSRAGYQVKWAVYRLWCRSEGHSISRPALPQVADFLFWLRRSRTLSVSAVMGYRSMLSLVFRLQLPEISSSPVIHDLLRSFKVEAPCCGVRPPSWDLEAVLRFLRSPIFEPLASSSLRDLTRKMPCSSYFAYGQVSRGDPSSISCRLLFFECWSFLCFGISS